ALRRCHRLKATPLPRRGEGDTLAVHPTIPFSPGWEKGEPSEARVGMRGQAGHGKSVVSPAFQGQESNRHAAFAPSQGEMPTRSVGRGVGRSVIGPLSLDSYRGGSQTRPYHYIRVIRVIRGPTLALTP